MKKCKNRFINIVVEENMTKWGKSWLLDVVSFDKYNLDIEPNHVILSQTK